VQHLHHGGIARAVLLMSSELMYLDAARKNRGDKRDAEAAAQVAHQVDHGTDWLLSSCGTPE